MSLYHFNVKQVSRGKGGCAVASAAYISGEKIQDDYYGKIHDYTKKGGVIHSEIILPDNAPERFNDRKTLLRNRKTIYTRKLHIKRNDS